NHRRLLYSVLALLLLLGAFLYTRLENNLLPKEDRGLIGAFIPMIAGYDLDQMEIYKDQVEQIFMEQPEIESTLTFSFPNGVQIVSMLKPMKERKVHAEKVVERLRELVS